MKGKKRMKFVIIGALALLVLAGAVLLFLLGKPANVRTDTRLDGVDEDVETALYYGSLAANSHNAQSWKVELDAQKEALTIAIDESRALDVVDPERRELYVSLGCYMESMAAAFDACGFEPLVTYTGFDGGSNGTVFISYRRRPEAEIKRDQLALLKRRHTDKSPYRTDVLTPETVSALLENREGIYYYSADTKEFAYLREKTMAAVTEQSAQQDYREELNRWMRFSNGEAEGKQDGVTAEMMGLGGFIKAFYYLSTNHGNAAGDTFAKQGVDTAQRQVDNCGAFFVITGNDTPLDWMEAGRRTQAFW